MNIYPHFPNPFSLLRPALHSITSMPPTQSSVPIPVMPAEIHDIKDVIKLPDPFLLWYFLGGGLVLLIVIGLSIYFLKKNKRKQTVPLPHEMALLDLESIRNLMTPAQSRAFAIGMAEVLRSYIGHRFLLFQPDLTTREFLHQLTRNNTETNPLLLNHDDLLNDWLNHCDMVKFARYTLKKEDMEQMYIQVRDFILSTQQSDSTRDGGMGQ
ncbi:MAG TPA: hypothetical protein ENK84_03765 [Desulfobulbus sp.]|nr:hypothetical protein [Desulfobulbus sp.]HHD62943.1 hypothetical protein [Desulfobulbaceae bacterium]